MMRKLEILFDEQVRPALAAHGGGVEIIDLDNDKLFVRLFGGCQGCSSSSATLFSGIQTLVKQNFPAHFIKCEPDGKFSDCGEKSWILSVTGAGESRQELGDPQIMQIFADGTVPVK